MSTCCAALYRPTGKFTFPSTGICRTFEGKIAVESGSAYVLLEWEFTLFNSEHETTAEFESANF